MTYLLAGFKADFISAYRQHFERDICCAPITVHWEETEQGQSFVQVERGVKWHYRLINGRYMPYFEADKIDRMQKAVYHLEEAWRRFEVFFRAAHKDLTSHERIYASMRGDLSFNIEKIYHGLQKMFPCFRGYQAEVPPPVHTDAANIYDLCLKIIPHEAKPEDVKDIIVGSREWSNDKELLQGIILLMSARAVMYQSWFSIMQEFGTPPKKVKIFRKGLNEAIVELSARREKHIDFVGGIFHIKDMIDTLEEIGSEIDRAAQLALGTVKPPADPEAYRDQVAFNKSCKAAASCDVVDDINIFILNDVLPAGAKGILETAPVRELAEIYATHARRACIFPAPDAQKGLAAAAFLGRQHAIAVKGMNDITPQINTLLSDPKFLRQVRTLGITHRLIDFMVATEYNLPNSVERIKETYKLNDTRRILPRPSFLSAHDGSRQVLAGR